MLLSVEEARAEVLSRSRPLPSRARPLADAYGCVLAEDVTSDLDVPPFDKALVDGYALASSDAQAGVRRYRVIEEVMAGRCPSLPLGPGETTLVMTGAPLPEGADAVVMHEKVQRDGTSVEIEPEDVAPGRNRLLRGRELRTGERVLTAGVRLEPAHLGVLATVGRDPVVVVPTPEVTVLPTGDELVEPCSVPGPGQIRNSNGVLLAGLVRATGCSAQVLATAPDEPQTLRARLQEGLQRDVLLITGGVSAGKLDLVPQVLAELGVERVFHKIRLKPGKPLWFGVGPPRGDSPGSLVFGLPGNPVSGLVGFLLFVRPALRLLSGVDSVESGEVVAQLAQPFTHRGDRPTYHPAVLHRDGSGPKIAEPLNWAGSADLLTVARSDGFLIFPAGDRVHDAGEIVGFLPLR
ncbi:MAG: gephyrin-like molybdotransferase Glp [Isosphaeraceae bacterium]